MNIVSSEEAKQSIHGALGMPATDRTDDIVVAEYIRQAVCDRCVPIGQVDSPIYVASITNNVRRQLSAAFPSVDRRVRRRPSEREQEAEGDLQPDPVRRVLEGLEDLREVVHLANGYYVPTPSRFIDLGEKVALIVSAWPTEALRKSLSADISMSWIARSVSVDRLPSWIRADETRWQSREAWLGVPPGDLESWTTSQLHSAHVNRSVSATGLSDFEVYAPAMHPTRPQAFRWVPANKLRNITSEIALCRVSEGKYFGMRRYWLGTLEKKGDVVSPKTETSIAFSDVRRLQYGFDFKIGAPTVVQVINADSGAKATLRNPLPAEERRALIALGRECSAKPGKFPLCYEFNREKFKVILQLFEDLRISIVTRNEVAR